MERGISLDRAISFVKLEKTNLSLELIHLDDVHGRILGKGLKSKVNDPRFDNSAMDGWAVCKEDCSENEETTLEIVGVSQAGAPPNHINSGQACKIMTGAPIPIGANAIVMVEDSEIDHLVEKITDYHGSMNGVQFKEKQSQCRHIWEQYCTKEGFINHFHQFLNQQYSFQGMGAFA